jgi:carbonic anhydrase/acetyltransferase-like protein (isoleucine patch superfamily)
MANIFEFNGYRPVVHESAFVHPNATVTGNVIIGRNVYIGPGAALRGDWGEIVVEDGCNIQENCTVHMFPGITVRLHEAAHIGHGAVIHGAVIGRNVLVGMNAVVMDRVVVGENSLIGALTFVPEGMIIPERRIVVGNPARIIKEMSDEMIAWKSKGTALYQELPAEMMATWKACEPLREVPADRPAQQDVYKSWSQSR